MLIHPYVDRLTVYPGTRILQDTLGVVGWVLQDPLELERMWTIHMLFAPIPKRALGGIRAKLVDQKQFVTFINQRDLEVLLGVGKVGGWCPWTGASYVGPGDKDWFGLCVDDVDLADDLHERELLLRAQQPTGTLVSGQELVRRVHHDQGRDEEELLTLLWDRDPDTMIVPDGRLETLDRRWVRIEKRKVLWQRL